MINRRYIFDSMYGVVNLPEFIWEVVTTPELQRLREIRLCNINSLCLTGGANINRFEHALGTCYLALRCYESWLFKKNISEAEKRAFLVAALFHDVANAAFGHSIEYIEGYKPESSFFDILTKVRGKAFTSNRASSENVFFGLSGTLYEVLVGKLKFTEGDLKMVSDAIQGKGLFGPLISNSIDLDNIDNVYRMAYHIGLIPKDTTPLDLATSLIIEDDELVISDDKISLLENWFFTRRLLYKFLLLNPEEFSGKCMLTEAIENSKKEDLLPFRWFDTDYELLKKISTISSNNAQLIPRLMIGDLYGCISILSSSNIDFYKNFLDTQKRNDMEKEIETILRGKYSNLKSALIALHPILDVNKTERKVKIKTTSQRYVEVGQSSNQLLIGIFFKNKELNINNVGDDFKNIVSIRIDIQKYFSSKLNDDRLIQLPLYAESREFIHN